MSRTQLITISLILVAAWIIFTAATANNVYLLHTYAHTPGNPDTIPLNHIDGAYKYGICAIISSALLGVWTLFLPLRKDQ